MTVGEKKCTPLRVSRLGEVTEACNMDRQMLLDLTVIKCRLSNYLRLRSHRKGATRGLLAMTRGLRLRALCIPQLEKIEQDGSSIDNSGSVDSDKVMHRIAIVLHCGGVEVDARNGGRVLGDPTDDSGLCIGIP
ncbi:hypothetical protein LR48_Vigan484s001500 [Vigna angularis]|uniref:Uncharacterized protein n=1 Tax=Phaseolus angularis TaxID=3914 RepID=A0A0L9TD03_PHAAN|nr:hypothetical protein LR48_Vigan484s001500 [Vigna angularis]